MFINDLLKVYDENYGLVSSIKNSVKERKVILIPYSLVVLSSISFFGVRLVGNELLRTKLMIFILIIYILSIVLSASVKGLIFKARFGSYRNYQRHKLVQIDKFIKEETKITNTNDYQLIDKLIRKEIGIIRYNKRFPFIDTIRQLLIAVLITGLLSYSVTELINGDSQIGYSLFSLYLMIVGSLIIIGILIYNLRDFGKLYKLKQISKILSELQIRAINE